MRIARSGVPVLVFVVAAMAGCSSRAVPPPVLGKTIAEISEYWGDNPQEMKPAGKPSIFDPNRYRHLEKLKNILDGKEGFLFYGSDKEDYLVVVFKNNKCTAFIAKIAGVEYSGQQ